MVNDNYNVRKPAPTLLAVSVCCAPCHNTLIDVAANDVLVSIREEVVARGEVPPQSKGSGNCESTDCPNIGAN